MRPIHAIPDETRLIWVDMEMTGLRPEIDRIIEIAIVVTDSELNVLAQSEAIAVHQPDEVLDGMDQWNRSTHGRSGLTERVRASAVWTEADAEQEMMRVPAPGCRQASRRCAATRSARTAASWRATCRSSRGGSTTAIWMSAR
jgi:hypothetical protein